MKTYKDIENLIEKYYNGETSLEEEKQLQVFFEGEDIPGHLKSYQDQFLSIGIMRSADSGMIANDDLFAKIEGPVKETKVIPLKPRNTVWFYRIAAAVVLVLVGYFVGNQLGGSEIDEVKEELAQMKKTMMNQLGSSSASGRLQAVSNSLDFEEADDEVVAVLIATMRNDQNMHVRSKAVEALVKFGDNSKVKLAITEALLEETEPAVQIALIEAVVTLKEKPAIETLEKMAESDAVLKEVQDEAHMSIFKLKKL